MCFVFQCYGEYVSGSINDDERMNVVRNSCPGAGACGGMYTANTMASAIETMGMSLPYRYEKLYNKYNFELSLVTASEVLTYYILFQTVKAHQPLQKIR